MLSIKNNHFIARNLLDSASSLILLSLCVSTSSVDATYIILVSVASAYQHVSRLMFIHQKEKVNYNILNNGSFAWLERRSLNEPILSQALKRFCQNEQKLKIFPYQVPNVSLFLLEINYLLVRTLRNMR